ncbi:cytochrome b-c1 complex subunit 9 [Podarcis muralis]|uniref:cytochrome b-c1 complex subunit 9 n=1 Tax=Podarcis muralis TaxID=64176 RepID=UPI0010A04240|nr:cytochrome b-c1 complex subunit 9 [Podarcis muralis]
MTLAKQVYRVLLRRSATFALTVVVGALLFERAFDQSADSIFEQVNKEKLWKHIKHKYEEPRDE